MPTTWTYAVSQPDVLKALDFISMYTGGRVAGVDYSQVYDIELQRKVQSELLGTSLKTAELLSFNHPPLLLPFETLVGNPGIRRSLSALEYDDGGLSHWNGSNLHPPLAVHELGAPFRRNPHRYLYVIQPYHH